MDQHKFRQIVEQIPHDPDKLERGIALRDGRYKPAIFFGLFCTALFSLAFAGVNLTRTYQVVGSYETCAILYSVLTGCAVAVFSGVDALYALQVIGLKAADLPQELYEVLRRDCTYTYVSPEMYQYIRPGMYHDDRVPRNNVSIWVLRICVPMLYAMSLTVAWAIADGRAASQDTPLGLQFLFGNVLLAFLGLLSVAVIVSNVYRVFKRWNYVPETFSVSQPPAPTQPAAARAGAHSAITNSILNKRK